MPKLIPILHEIQKIFCAFILAYAALEVGLSTGDAWAISVAGCDIGINANKIAACIQGKLNELNGNIARLQQDLANSKNALQVAIRNGDRGVAEAIQNGDRRVADMARVADQRINEATAPLRQQISTFEKEIDARSTELLAKNRLIANLQKKIEGMNTIAEGSLRAGERTVLQAFRDLQQERMLQCAVQLPGTYERGFLSNVERLVRNPVEFTTTMAHSTLTSAIPSFENVMSEELGVLAGTVPPPVKGSELIDLYWTKIKRLSVLDPGLQCIVAELDPQFPAIREGADAFQEEMERWARNIFDAKVRPLVYRGLAKGLEQLIVKDGGEDREEMNVIAQGVASRHIVDSSRWDDAASQISNFSGLTDPGKVNAAAENVRNSLDELSPAIGPKLYVDVFSELLRYKVHKHLRSGAAPDVTSIRLPGGGWLIDQGMSAGSSFISVIIAEINSLCGLIPEAGAAWCANTAEPGQMFWEHVLKPAVKGSILSAIENQLDQAVDYTRLRLLAEVGESADARLADMRGEAGILGQELDRLQAGVAVEYAKRFIGPSVASIKTYHQSVKQLVSLRVASVQAGMHAVPDSSCPGLSRMGPVEMNSDRFGMDYSSIEANQVQHCQAACEVDTRCRAFAFAQPDTLEPSGRCWLKEAVPALRARHGFVSGAKQ